MSEFFNPGNSGGFRVNQFNDQPNKNQASEPAAEQTHTPAPKFEGQTVSANRVFDLMAQQARMSQTNVEFGSALDFASAFTPEAYESSINGILQAMPGEVRGLSEGAQRALAEEVFLTQHLGTPALGV